MKNKFARLGLLGLLLAMCWCSCSTEPKASGGTPKEIPGKTTADLPVPDFQADTAYAFIEKQLSFGPRVPNTSAHVACANWLEQQLRAYGARIHLQPAEVVAYNGTRLYMQNIIASFQPEKKQRIMLSAHWDTRHIAEADSLRPHEPIPGANDGGSGVGVLLEVARLLGKHPSRVGVDIFLWDAEDYGDP
ncbi:MAG: M28 family peptidase, partial [Bacteroidetes bacterium]